MIILILVGIIGLSSIYSAGMGIRDAINKQSDDFIFLKLFSSSGDFIPSFASFISFLVPLVGLSLGFDAINGERARGTLSRLLAQPIHRNTVIIGKFLAGTSMLAMMVLSLCVAVAGLGIIMIGIPPSFEEIGRLAVYLALTIVYVGIWYAISLVLSLMFRQTATSALAGIALWLFMAVFVGLLAGIIANGMYPVNDHPSIETVLKHETLKQNLSRISPLTIYNEAVTTILNPGIRTMGLIMSSQLEGAIAGTLPSARVCCLSGRTLLPWRL